MVFFQLAIFVYTLWLGAYLLAQNPADVRLRLTGLGLIAYALVVATLPFTTFPQIEALQSGLLLLPPLFWLGALVALLPENHALHDLLRRFIRFGLPWAAALLAVLGFFLSETPLFWLLATVVALALLASLIAAIIALQQGDGQLSASLILLVTLFFALGIGLLLLPIEIDWLPRSWIVLALSVDLELLGLLILWRDAYDQGEEFQRDTVRSAMVAVLAVLVFGGQILLMQPRTGRSVGDNLLLFSVSGTAVLVTVFWPFLSRRLDRWVYPSTVAQARQELHTAAAAVTRQATSNKRLAELPPQEFRKLIRRALTHLQDPARLAASPLTRLPQIDERLNGSTNVNNILDRAAILRELLIEHIMQLKPTDELDFAPTDAWRYYNAVYFPYVVGLKPYSRRAWHDHLSPAEKEALDWFRAQVPERTLYNWQNKAAELIAQQLTII